jgi:uncharacterized membrane protein HdeD (DUF308 family)
MSNGIRKDAADVLADVGRHWGWLLAFGIITVAAGIVALAWPDSTLVVIAVVFGIQLMVAGIFRFVGAFAAGDEGAGTRVLWAILGVLSFIIGLYALRHIVATVLALAILLGIFWIVSGTIELFTALSFRAMPGRGWTIFMGLLSVVAGVILLVYPNISLWALVVVVSVWLLVYGFMEIVLAFRLRSVGQAAHRVATAT